jgi:hypothetical protein
MRQFKMSGSLALSDQDVRLSLAAATRRAGGLNCVHSESFVENHDCNGLP